MYYKVRQLFVLQSALIFITKCVGSVITKRVNFHYKGVSGITKCDFITKWDFITKLVSTVVTRHQKINLIRRQKLVWTFRQS